MERREQLRGRCGLRQFERASGNGFDMTHGAVSKHETGERFTRTGCEKRTAGKEELNSTHPTQYICSDFPRRNGSGHTNVGGKQAPLSIRRQL